MKLWQKISLIALVFVTLAVQLTQFYILDSHFRSAIAREVNSAASAHSALAASLSNHAAYERLKANTLFLSTDQLTDMLKDTITTDISTADVIEVKKGGKTITAVGTEVLDGASYDLASVKPNDAITDGKTVIFDAGEKTYLMMVSIIKLEAMSYELRTVYDVTNVYDEHDANLNNARMWGLCCGGGISVLLLISVLGFLRPLKRAVKTIGAAAAGDYTVRMPEKGSSELKTLAHSINEMTASINEREEKLRGIAESRKRFADAMAHEMKTPLTSISGYAELIESGMAQGEQAKTFAAEIHKSANRLLTLINDIIRLSQMDAPMPDLKFEPVDLAQIAANTFEQLEMSARKADVTLQLDAKPAMVEADRQMMDELLYNLCDNAIRYNVHGGSVKLEVRPIRDKVIVCVQDTGIGISPENQEHVFERFYRVDKSRSKATGGTGLGLAIVKHIAVKHNAQIELESELGRGTKISVIFERCFKG